MNLTTPWLGMTLKNPFVPSASPLSRDVDACRRLEDAGASAIIMYSLFEEEIAAEEEQLQHLWEFQDIGHTETSSYLPTHHDYKTCEEAYLEQLAALKKALDIPVVASLNGTTPEGWTGHARDLEEAGADALELNIYYVPTNMSESGQMVEDRYIEIIERVRQSTSIPLTVKLSQQFSSPGHFIKQIEGTGADGVGLFNRFFHPDLDLEKLEITSVLTPSCPHDALLRLHWVALIRNRVKLSIGATGGIHDATDVIKLLLAGADVTHLCTTLLLHGPERIQEIEHGLAEWMERNEYESVAQMKGCVSQMNVTDPAAYERMNYMETLKSFGICEEAGNRIFGFRR
ncbi:MAG TPA: dihydroorotate dehydrogenase-like protein [Rhodobacteraceae bacterium]|nr:dihydroorotate dehydrogenase-like protein [Paracoccaceae bacterium]